MKNIPKIIYLQIGEDCPDDTDFNSLSENVTWAMENIFGNDLKYVLVGEVSMNNHIKDLYKLYYTGRLKTLNMEDSFLNPKLWDAETRLIPQKKHQLYEILAKKLFLKEYSETTIVERERIEDFYQSILTYYDTFMEYLKKETQVFQRFLQALEKLFQDFDDTLEHHLYEWLEHQVDREIEWRNYHEDFI